MAENYVDGEYTKTRGQDYVDYLVKCGKWVYVDRFPALHWPIRFLLSFFLILF